MCTKGSINKSFNHLNTILPVVPVDHFTKIKTLKENSSLKKSFVKIKGILPKHKQPLPYYRGHYFHDTPVTCPTGAIKEQN